MSSRASRRSWPVIRRWMTSTAAASSRQSRYLPRPPAPTTRRSAELVGNSAIDWRRTVRRPVTSTSTTAGRRRALRDRGGRSRPRAAQASPVAVAAAVAPRAPQRIDARPRRSACFFERPSPAPVTPPTATSATKTLGVLGALVGDARSGTAKPSCERAPGGGSSGRRGPSAAASSSIISPRCSRTNGRPRPGRSGGRPRR